MSRSKHTLLVLNEEVIELSLVLFTAESMSRLSFRPFQAWRTSAGDNSCSSCSWEDVFQWHVLLHCWDSELSTCPSDLHSTTRQQHRTAAVPVCNQLCLQTHDKRMRVQIVNSILQHDCTNSVRIL